jgi:hypothetical protein
VSYLALVTELESTWSEFSGGEDTTHPFAFSNKEREELEADVEGVARGMESMHLIRESPGELLPGQGIVKSDNYEEALDTVSSIHSLPMQLREKPRRRCGRLVLE